MVWTMTMFYSALDRGLKNQSVSKCWTLDQVLSQKVCNLIADYLYLLPSLLC
jgi:hypothetical protein